MKKIVSIIFIAALASLLQSCVVVAAGAGVATGAVVVNDKRTVKIIADDQNIEYTATSEINQLPGINENSHVSVIAYNHAVLLVGQAPSDEVRSKVDALVQSLPKVTRVYNQIQIRKATTAMRRTEDTWITTKVKTNMIAEKGLNSGQIKVVTENGVVYLMGIVTPSQSRVASEVARRVSGVKRVVTLFENAPSQ